MGMIMTSAGLALIARLQAENKVAKINRMVYAFKSGVSSDTMPSASEIIPSDVRYNDNNISGKFVDASNVVYFSKLDTSVGDFSFNWLGLFCVEHNTLMAICHTDLQYKKRSEGFSTGNFMTKNLGFGLVNVTETLQVTVEAGSSDVNFNAWLKSADERLRNSNSRLIGSGLEQAITSTIVSAGYVYPFIAWCGGLRVENKSTQAIGFSGVAGEAVWLEAWIDNSVRNSEVKWRLVKTIASQNLVDVFDGATWHYFLKLAVYTSASTFSNVFDSVGQHKLMREATDAEILAGANGVVLTPSGFLKKAASVTGAGVARFATEIEAMNFADNVILSPAKLQAVKADYNKYGMVKLATENEVKSGAKNVAVTPEMLHKVAPTGTTPGLVKFASGQDVIDNLTNVAVTPASMRALTATTERDGLIRLATDSQIRSRSVERNSTLGMSARSFVNWCHEGVTLYSGLASQIRGLRGVSMGSTYNYGMAIRIPEWVRVLNISWSENTDAAEKCLFSSVKIKDSNGAWVSGLSSIKISRTDKGCYIQFFNYDDAKNNLGDGSRSYANGDHFYFTGSSVYTNDFVTVIGTDLMEHLDHNVY